MFDNVFQFIIEINISWGAISFYIIKLFTVYSYIAVLVPPTVRHFSINTRFTLWYKFVLPNKILIIYINNFTGILKSVYIFWNVYCIPIIIPVRLTHAIHKLLHSNL